MRKQLFEARDAAAHAVWQSGTIHTSLTDLRRMKIHDKYPDAPLSPIYFSLRPAGVKDGKLLPEHLDKIGYAMGLMGIQQGGLFRQNTFTWVAGIPAAGEPILDAIIRNIGPRRATRILSFKLEKEETEGGRRIAGIHPDYNGLVPNEVLDSHVLVDDLMSNRQTKLEAIDAIQKYGASVSTILLFLDRSIGGVDWFRNNSSVRVLSLWTYDNLLDFGLANSYLDRTTYEAIVQYPAELQRYLDEHAA